VTGRPDTVRLTAGPWVTLPGTNIQARLVGKMRGGSDGVTVHRDGRDRRLGGWNLRPLSGLCQIRAAPPPAPGRQSS